MRDKRENNDEDMTYSERRQARRDERLAQRNVYKEDKSEGYSYNHSEPEHKRPQSIWEKLGEERLYSQLREMGDSDKNIDNFQIKRIVWTLLFMAVTLLLAIIVHPWLYIAVPIVGFASYKMQLKKVDDYYRVWKFERQLNFSKFTRLVIPYLKASEGNMALYTIFNRILQRLDNDTDRLSLYRLMGEMSDNPSDIQPFLDYAERSSGTDMSHLFMSTIFDFQQTTFNTDVIDELGKIASDDMMNSIDEIIDMKLRRFVMFPTKVVMTSFILVVGLGAGILFHNLKDIDLGGGGLSSIEDGPDTEEVIEDSTKNNTEMIIELDE